jgi:hypothetical protein
MSASLIMFEKEYAAREKYGYFICTVASALVAYLGKDFFPEHPFDARENLTVWSLSSLTASFGFGLAFLIFCIKAISLNKDLLVGSEEVANFYNTVTLRETKQSNYTRNLKTGRLYKSTEELLKLAHKKRVANIFTFRKMRKWYWWSEVWFIIAHVFLVLGFCLLIAAKFI